jgi:ribose transport system substrate-binding protein
MYQGLSSLTRAALAAGLAGSIVLAPHVTARAARPPATGRTVAILTPYLTAPATHEMVGLLQKDAAPYGWKTSVVSSDGDIGALAGKMEDTIARKVDAIVVVSTDLHLLKKQIADAGAARIPVFGLDAASIPGVAASASSNSDQMSSLVTEYLFKRLGYKGNLIVLTYTPQPEVNERTKQFYRLLKRYPALHVVAQQQIDVSSMVQSGNGITTNLLTANPKPGAIAGVWCGWDQPAIGAAQAIQAAHRAGVIVTGIDGSDQAVSLIKKGSPLVATVKQHFDTQASMITAQVARVFAGKGPSSRQLYAPAALITRGA